MTNPISKAIVKAAVAMGYGKKSDYKGSSVADVLEKFAAIAKDKGSSGSSEPFVVEIEGIGTEQAPSATAVFADAKAAFLAGHIIIFSLSFGGVLQKVYAASYVDYGEGREKLVAFMGENNMLSWNSDGTFSDK